MQPGVIEAASEISDYPEHVQDAIDDYLSTAAREGKTIDPSQGVTSLYATALRRKADHRLTLLQTV